MGEGGTAFPVFLGGSSEDVDVATGICASLLRYHGVGKRESERRQSTYEGEVTLALSFPGKVFGAGPNFVDCFGRAFTSLTFGLRDTVNKLARIMCFAEHTEVVR